MSTFSLRDFLARVTGLSAKRDHYDDFGYPDHVTFSQLHKMYLRNDLAKAAVRKTTEKTFQNLPEIMIGDNPIEGLAEAFDRLGFWDKMADTDEYAQVGGYSGIVFRIADGKRFDEPVDGTYTIDDLVEIIPAWSEQLRVSEWHNDETDGDSYGKPKTFTFNESAVERREGSTRSVVVHPDRVFVWSPDGTVHCPSALLSGYNNLLDMEKISGAGGEGFWKTAAARLNIEIDKDTDFETFKRSVEAQTGKSFQDALDEKAKKLNAGFDSSYISQGMKVGTFSISLPQPKEFFDIPLQAFAAGRSMPTKILIGMQTGERASTEDAQDWNNTITSRRNRWTIPSIKALLQKLEAFGMIPPKWQIEWEELSGDTPDARLARSAQMAEINVKQMSAERQIVFTAEEIRGEAGYDDELPETPSDLEEVI